MPVYLFLSHFIFNQAPGQHENGHFTVNRDLGTGWAGWAFAHPVFRLGGQMPTQFSDSDLRKI